MESDDAELTLADEVRELQATLDSVIAKNERLRKFAEFVLKWCDRGAPHAGPGQEAVALDAIRNHPVLSAMRRSQT